MLRKIINVTGGMIAGLALAAGLAWSGSPTQAAQNTPQAAIVSEFNGPGGRGRGEGQGQRQEENVTRAAIKSTADLTKLTTQQVVDAVKGGKSLAQVASANSSSGQAVIDDVVAKAKERLDQAVANGRITQAEADTKLAEIKTKATEVVNDTTLGQKISDRQAQGGPQNHALVQAAADVTGLDPSAIRDRISNGETLKQIIESSGKTTAEVLDAAVAEFRTRAEEALK